MATPVIMPRQGQSVESCIIGSINKKKGDSVKKGDVLFSYETDKASFEEESPADGVVLECFYKEGDEVPVLENMMVIGEPGENYSALLQGSQEPHPAPAPRTPELASRTPESATHILEPATRNPDPGTLLLISRTAPDATPRA